MKSLSLFLFFPLICGLLLGNTALTDLEYDSSKTYSKGDAVIPSSTEFKLYTAKKSVPAGPNGPPNTDYWQTAEEYTTELQNTYSDTVSTPPSNDNINTDEITGLGTPPELSNNTTSSIRLANISTRGYVGTGDSRMIVSFIIEGTGSKTVTIRALGPVLATAFGVKGVLSNPYLEVRNQQTEELIVANDNWADATSSSAVTSSGKSDGIDSLESAVQVTLEAGQYSAIVSGVGGATGNALVEVYDEDSSNSSSTIRLANISTRGYVGTGDSRMIVSFIIEGTGSKTVTIRALGPVLATAFGVKGVLSNPYLEVRNQQTEELIVANDNWADATSSSAVSSSGKSDGIDSLESAVQVSLEAGQYSAIVSGVGGATGNALVEVYDED